MKLTNRRGAITLIAGLIAAAAARPPMAAAQSFPDLALAASTDAMTDPAANALVDPAPFIANCYQDILLSGTLSFVDGHRTAYFNRVAIVASTCPSAPAADCRAAGGSSFTLVSHADPNKNKLKWSWTKGAALGDVELGDPTTDTNYLLCVYADGSLLFQTTVAAGSLWQAAGKATPPTKFQYKDKLGASDGVTVASVAAGADGKAKALLKGAGGHLPAFALPLAATDVSVQLYSSDLPRHCLGASYTGPPKKNDGKTFKTKM